MTGAEPLIYEAVKRVHMCQHRQQFSLLLAQFANINSAQCQRWLGTIEFMEFVSATDWSRHMLNKPLKISKSPTQLKPQRSSTHWPSLQGLFSSCRCKMHLKVQRNTLYLFTSISFPVQPAGFLRAWYKCVRKATRKKKSPAFYNFYSPCLGARVKPRWPIEDSVEPVSYSTAPCRTMRQLFSCSGIACIRFNRLV